MYAVIFEVTPKEDGIEEYLDIAKKLRVLLKDNPGFISIERFQSLTEQNKLLSLSFWETEAAIANWKENIDHQLAQQRGKDSLFKSYRIRVAKVERDYASIA
ncbi:conserved hypothetical protein [Shewanella sediminis HAW-EB3]|uniref:ABM domain-containing protein n=1 Tax=Shewanella sediminis (strain HAW-EB3) TaxID=425104 RepID=A8FSU1_SHESH|nr:antibiotic biosynthesis monooxygenase [Shewanella sediminis]ABV35914.1 conserved hypothetical protein [Shewanella sediminis HAW-EB3]